MAAQPRRAAARDAALLAGWATLLSRLPLCTPSTAGLSRAALAPAAAVYAVNQAVDGVAIRHVAHAYVDSPTPLRPASLLVADAVRHLEIGPTGCFQALIAPHCC